MTAATRKPHVHAEAIRAFADGAQIQAREAGIADEWTDRQNPSFYPQCEYRVKPEKVYPRNALEHSVMFEVYASKCREMGYTSVSAESVALNEVANAAIRHSIDAGQVITATDHQAAIALFGERLRDVAIEREKGREMAIAESVRAALMNARYTIQGEDSLDLAAIIAKVAP